MPRYEQLASEYFRRQAAYGNDAVAVNTLIEARIFSELSNGKLTLNGRNFADANGKIIPPVMDLMLPSMGIGGMFYSLPVYPGVKSGTVTTTNPDPAFLRDFVINDISEYLGPENFNVLVELGEIWREEIERVEILPPFSARSVARFVNLGVLAWPVDVDTAATLYPLRDEMWEPNIPAEARQRWQRLAAILHQMKREYSVKNFQLAVAEGKTLRENVAQWDRLLKVTEFIVAAPTKVIEVGGKFVAETSSAAASTVFDLVKKNIGFLAAVAALVGGFVVLKNTRFKAS